MGIHQQRTHPEYVEGCAACRWSTALLSGNATPSRTPEVPYHTRGDAKLDADIAAYRTLRKQGLQPPQVRNSAERARTATRREHIETRHPWSKNASKPLVKVADRHSERTS